METKITTNDILNILQEKYPNKKIRFVEFGDNNSSDAYFLVGDKD